MKFVDFINEKNQPLIFRNCIKNWSARNWTLDSLSQILQGKSIKCKIGPKFQGLYETECLYLEITMANFIEWCHGKCSLTNPLSEIDTEKYFCYLDYQYMSELFDNNTDVLKDIDWSCFGLDNRDGNDSTIWLGSEGCTTPCHYDTYGFNLVAQIYGSKRWYLFPPSDSEYIYPTRIPYEESSVFCEVNITQPDLNLHPEFKKCHVFIVTLQPGDILYVPRHWWHYVECLQTAISINTWVEMKEDKESRVKESIYRILISSLIHNTPQTTDHNHFINPNEILQPSEVNLEYLKIALQDLENSRNQINNTKITGNTETDSNKSSKKLRKSSSDDETSKENINSGAFSSDTQSGATFAENKFQQFCNKFSSWEIDMFSTKPKVQGNSRKRIMVNELDHSDEKILKLSQKPEISSSKNRIEAANVNENDSAINSNIYNNEKVVNITTSPKKDSFTENNSNSKSDKDHPPQIIAVSESNFEGLKKVTEECLKLKEKESFERKPPKTTTDFLFYRLIKSVMKPTIINHIFEDLN